jgi:type IV pilus assembly protein PilW
MSRPRNARTRAAARGMTLVELMVGATIGMFLVAVMGTVYVGSKSTYVVQETTSRLQENGRFTMDTIAQDLRMSGFRGCLAQTDVNNTLNSATTLAYNFAQPIWGSHHNGAAWVPAHSAPLTTLSPDSAGDVLVVRRPVGVAWSLIAEMADVNAALTITPNADFVQGDLLMVADCAGATVLQATNATPGAASSIEHRVAGGGTPGVASDSLGRLFANDARVWRMQTLIYHLAASERHPGERALWVYRAPAYAGEEQRTELVTGIERMAVTFGVDTNADTAADRFQSADAVGNWSQVVSARIELLLVGDADSMSTAPQPYTFAGTLTTPSDHRLRTVMSMLVSLRNAVP